MKLFIFVTILTFLILGIIAFILYCALPYIVNSYVGLCEKISKFILRYKKVNWVLVKYTIYTLYFISTLVFIYLTYSLLYNNGEKVILLTLVIYPLLLIFLATLLEEMKLNNKVVVKLPAFNMNNYFINRINLLFGKLFSHMIIYLLVLYVLITTIVTFGPERIPLHIIYIFFLLLPVSLVLFIYLGVYDRDERNVRRIVSYVVLLSLAFLDSYNKFRNMLFDEENIAINYAIYIVLAVFSALENTIQAIFNDYYSYKRERGK